MKQIRSNIAIALCVMSLAAFPTVSQAQLPMTKTGVQAYKGYQSAQSRIQKNQSQRINKYNRPAPPSPKISTPSISVPSANFVPKTNKNTTQAPRLHQAVPKAQPSKTKKTQKAPKRKR